jgi:hypothetical protein
VLNGAKELKENLSLRNSNASYRLLGLLRIVFVPATSEQYVNGSVVCAKVACRCAALNRSFTKKAQM